MDDQETRKRQLLAGLNEARSVVRRTAVRYTALFVVLAAVFWVSATNQQVWGRTLPAVFLIAAMWPFVVALLHWMALWRHR
jgi:hypothetical protein